MSFDMTALTMKRTIYLLKLKKQGMRNEIKK